MSMCFESVTRRERVDRTTQVGNTIRGLCLCLLCSIAAGSRHARPATRGVFGNIALDPDIPAPLQRVGFRAQAAQGLRWALDGKAFGPADEECAWTARPGAHELKLVGAGGARRPPPLDSRVPGALWRMALNCAVAGAQASTFSSSSGGSPGSSSGVYSGESER
jgi:penicillin-binding protein 1C